MQRLVRLLPVLACLQAAILGAQHEVLAREARSRDPGRRVAAFEALLALGEEGRPLLTGALRDNARALGAARGQLLGSQAFAAARAALDADLVQARREALAFIGNEALFAKGIGIQEMALLVQKVRLFWEQPEDHLAERLKELPALRDQAAEIARYAGRAGLEEFERTEPEFLAVVRQAIAVERMGFSASQIRWNQEVTVWNESEAPTSANPEEFEAARLTNDYRMMMGLRALELDERILRAARAHSQEMEDLDYFAHTSPVAAHASPAARMRLHGYSGPLGENIARALSAAHAFNGWFHSAGHHRNMLSGQATAFAVGRSRGPEGSYLWTMKLGAGDTLRGKTLSDASLLYLQRKRKVAPDDPHAMLELARWCAARGLVREMSEACRIVLRLDPSLSEARELLARRFEMAEKAGR